MKTDEEILSEVTGFTVEELKERQTEPLIQPFDCLLAMQQVKLFNTPAVSKCEDFEREALFALLKWMQDDPIFNIDSIDEILDDYEYYKANCF